MASGQEPWLMNNVQTPLSNPSAEMERVLVAAEEREVVLRAIGGVAVSLRCPSARREPLRRSYKDLDLVGKSGQAQAIGSLMEDLGYMPDREFNVLHGHQRLYFWDAANQRQLDVFIDNFEMCHPLALKDRLDLEARTIPLADLLLTKLQVVEVNEKDLKDTAALLADHDIAPEAIDPDRIVSLLRGDWGWWRTATENLGKVRDYATSLADLEEGLVIRDRLDGLIGRIEDAPKTFKWKIRARVGEKVRWYDLPEEVEA
jgi:hypothetical protein